LEQLNRDLQEENEILKKAMHFFTKDPRWSIRLFVNIASSIGLRSCAQSCKYQEADITNG
jgi:hypothetical protein